MRTRRLLPWILALTLCPARATDLAAAAAGDILREIFANNRSVSRAPLVLLTPKSALACNPLVKALESAGPGITHFFAADTSTILSSATQADVFNEAPGPAVSAAPTKFEDFLFATPHGGVLLFHTGVAQDNAWTVGRVAEMFKRGQHVSAAGRYRVDRHPVVLQAGERVLLPSSKPLRQVLPPPIWSGKLGDCEYELYNGEAVSFRLNALDAAAAATPAKPIETEPTMREFSADIVTRIGRASQPLLLPPLVILTPIAGHSCDMLAADIAEVSRDIAPTYVIQSSDAQAFDHASFRDFVAKNTRGLVVTRASAVRVQTEKATARIGELLTSQWLETPKQNYPTQQFAHVLQTHEDAELIKGLTIGSLLPRAHLGQTSRGCRYSLFPGVAILTLLKEHASCRRPLTSGAAP